MDVYIPVFAFALVLVCVTAVRSIRYRKTEYYRQTKYPYLKVRLNKGLLGEYCTYRYLAPLDGYKRYLFNLYVPKDDGETTELDVVLLHESGIYVFESKNYSGWIFGTETQQYWTQTLPAGRGRSLKNRFFNPIMQNKGHIKWLRSYLADQTLPFYSYIVFSDRCELKDINLTSGKHCVVNRYDLFSAVRQNAAAEGRRLSPEMIDGISDKLYPLTQADEARKAMHIQNIRRNTQENDVPPVSPDKAETADETERACPRCGGKLIIRTAGRGAHKGEQFLGCSNYPKCRYTEEMPGENREAAGLNSERNI